jgi:hypothetical protein
MLRALWKRRGFAAVVIATLTLGLGATIGIFSVANAVLLRPLPYPDAGRIVVLRTLAEDGTPTARVAPRDMTALYDDHPSLSAAALAFYTEGRVTGNDAVDGLAIGLVLALLAGRAVQSFLGYVSGADPLALVASPLIMIACAVAASWCAASVDPLAALREE